MSNYSNEKIPRIKTQTNLNQKYFLEFEWNSTLWFLFQIFDKLFNIQD